MIEKVFRLPTKNDFSVYTTLRQQGASKIVIHIHGLTHTMNHLLEVLSADYFLEQGYDHCRIGLYTRDADSRPLSKATMSSHVSDIKAVIDYFAQQYDDVYVSAHSLAGLCMMILNPDNVKAMSLWDPSLDVPNFWRAAGCLNHVASLNQYHLNYGNVYVLSEEMVQEIEQYPTDKCQKLAQEISIPTQFIIPDETIFLGSEQLQPEEYRYVFGGDFDCQHIHDANHTFSKAGNQQILFEKTWSWFENY